MPHAPHGICSMWGALVISPLFLDGVLTIGLWGLFEVRPVVLCSSHTPQGSLWVIWAIGCGGFMPLEPPSVLLQSFGPFCLGTLFARFGLWIATNMATAGPKHPQEFPWASGGAGWQWGAAKPMSGPSRAHETAISPSGLPDGSWVLFFFSGRVPFGNGWDLALLASADHRRVTRL